MLSSASSSWAFIVLMLLVAETASRNVPPHWHNRTFAILESGAIGGPEYIEMSGVFGEKHVAPVKGKLLLAQSGECKMSCDHACRLPLRLSTRDGLPPHAPWIALVRSGHCSLDQKVGNAFRSNASAVVIFDDGPEESSYLLKMNVSIRRNISVVFTNRETGERLKRRAQEMSSRSGENLELSICIDTRIELKHYTDIIVLFSFFVIFGFLFVCSLCVKYEEHPKAAWNYCSEKVTNVIPRLRGWFAALLDTIVCCQKSYGECSICLETVFKFDARTLPCSHTFHSRCIEQWLENRSGNDCSCPMCRTIIFNFYCDE